MLLISIQDPEKTDRVIKFQYSLYCKAFLFAREISWTGRKRQEESPEKFAKLSGLIIGCGVLTGLL